MKKQPTEMNLTLDQLNSGIITTINERNSRVKLDRIINSGIRVSNDKKAISKDFKAKSDSLREVLANWSPDLDTKMFNENPNTKTGLVKFYQMSKDPSGRDILITALSKGVDSVAMLFEKTNAAIVGLVKPHLYGIKFNTGTDSGDLEALDTLTQQLVICAFGNFLIAHDFNKNNKQHNWVLVNKLISEKSLAKRLRPKNLPTQLNDWESQSRDMEYNGKTLFHVKTAYSASTWLFIERMAKMVFTVGEMGMSEEEILAYLKTRKDYGSLVGTHKAVWSKNRHTNKSEVRYERVRLNPTDKGKAYVRRIITTMRSYVGKAIHLPVKHTGNGRLDYLCSTIGLSVHGSGRETAVFENYEKEVITPIGLEEIKWGIVTEIAKKKMNLNSALKYFDKNYESILDTELDPQKLYERKLIQAYHDGVAGTPSGFLLGADGTNGGAQIIGSQVQEKASCVDSNMGGLVSFYDMYEVALKLLLESGVIPKGDVYDSLERNNLKSAVQSWLYGAGAVTMAAAHKNDDPSLWDTVKDVVVVDIKTLGLIVKNALANEYPYLAGAIALIGKTQADILKQADGSITGFQWTRGESSTVFQSVNVNPSETITVYFVKADGKLGQRTITRVAPDHTEHSVNLPANLTHCLDEYIIERIVMAVDTNFITKHDDFRCHANYMRETRKVYVNSVVDMAEENLLENMASEALGVKINLPRAQGKDAISFAKMRKSVNALM